MFVLDHRVATKFWCDVLDWVVVDQEHDGRTIGHVWMWARGPTSHGLFNGVEPTCHHGSVQ